MFLPYRACTAGKWLAFETEKWGKVIQVSGAKPD